MKKFLGISVIGCGFMGGFHAEAWESREDCTVVTVYDPDRPRAETLAARCNAESRESWRAAIDRPDVDIVSICTPVCSHAEIAIFAARAGKHVLCEKPIALTLEDGRAMDIAAKESGVHLGVSYQYRGFNQYKCYHTLLQQGRVKGPVMMRFADVREVRPKLAMHQKSMNGGPLIDMAGHFFDLMRFITGEEPQTVYANGFAFGKDKLRLSGIPEEDVAIDAAEIQVRYSGGHIASVMVHWGLPEDSIGYTNEVMVTPDAVVRTEPGRGVVIDSGMESRVIRLQPNPSGPTVCTEALARAAAGEAFTGVTAKDGCTALAVSLAALESIAAGKIVDVPGVEAAI